MPNHEFVKHLQAHRNNLAEEMETVDKLLSRYTDAPPPAIGARWQIIEAGREG